MAPYPGVYIPCIFVQAYLCEPSYAIHGDTRELSSYQRIETGIQPANHRVAKRRGLLFRYDAVLLTASV